MAAAEEAAEAAEEDAEPVVAHADEADAAADDDAEEAEAAAAGGVTRASWPQAAAMSWPISWRRRTRSPKLSMTTFPNLRHASGDGGRKPCVSAVTLGLYGIRLTMTKGVVWSGGGG